MLGSQGSGVTKAVRREQGTEGEPAVRSLQGLCSAASQESSFCPSPGVHWGQ